MAHFAKLDETNKVIAVHKVNDKDCKNADGVEDELVGQQYLEALHGHSAAQWKQTSYNTLHNTHSLGGTPFRKNYAEREGTYDPVRDAFIVGKEYNSWVLNEDTCDWEPPVPYPDAHGADTHKWNEETTSWDEIEQS